jgi:sugar lactone lactonase YvrE
MPLRRVRSRVRSPCRTTSSPKASRSGGGPSLVAPGTAGHPSVGLKIDRRGRLFVAGGAAGDARVIDARSGRTLASFQFATAPAFVNDVALTRGAAWFTDSQRPQLYKVPIGRRGAIGTPVTVPLSGDFTQLPGFNANGIERTPDGRALLIVSSAHRALFRVDPATGVATLVRMTGSDATNGDGLLLAGRTLYVVQNRLNRVAVFRLDRAGTQATFVRALTSPRFDVPTTAAKFGNRLYLPNARFTTPPTPETPYWITAIDR